MCRHTSPNVSAPHLRHLPQLTLVQTFCGHSRKHYLERLRSQSRFRFYLCPKTQEDIRQTISANGQIPRVNVLASVCGYNLGAGYVGKILSDKFMIQVRFVAKHMKTATRKPMRSENNFLVSQVHGGFGPGFDRMTGGPAHHQQVLSNCLESSVGTISDQALAILAKGLGADLGASSLADGGFASPFAHTTGGSASYPQIMSSGLESAASTITDQALATLAEQFGADLHIAH